MIHKFHVDEEKMQKSLFFCKCKQTFKAEKAWEFIDKDRAEVSGVSDQVSYLTLSKRNWLFQMRKNKVDGRTRLLVLAAWKIESYVPWCFHCWHGFSMCTHLSSWVSFSFFLQTPSTCLQHLPTCFIGWNVNPHWLALKKRKWKIDRKLFPYWPCHASSGIQRLQRIFPARSNIWAHSAIDMSSIVQEK